MLAMPPSGNFHIFKKKDSVGGVSSQSVGVVKLTIGATGSTVATEGNSCRGSFGIP